MVTRLDDNVYVRSGDNREQSLLVWSPVEGEDCVTEFKSLDGLRKLHPEFEAHSRYLDNYTGSVFKSPELKRFELSVDLALAPSVNTLPAEIQKLLGWPDQAMQVPGAYPR